MHAHTHTSPPPHPRTTTTHRFVGGPGTPGVLVVKRRLMRGDTVPERPGGGTVFFVQEHAHRYLG